MNSPLSTWINSLGLVLDIVGAIILWQFGITALIEPQGNAFLVCGPVDEETRQADVALYKRHKRMSNLGLFLLVLGFVGQLASNFVG
jgi:hypothetical protein